MKSIFRNLLLISVGSALLSIGIKSTVMPNGFLTGGLAGVAVLLCYFFNKMPVGATYLIINIPIFLAGWLFVGRKFFLYSLYGMVFLSASIDYINLPLLSHDLLLNCIFGGAMVGIGLGLVLLSEGSTGGLDIIGVILKKKWDVPMGAFFFAFNVALFLLSIMLIDRDLLLYSILMSYVVSKTMDYTLSEGGPK